MSSSKRPREKKDAAVDRGDDKRKHTKLVKFADKEEEEEEDEEGEEEEAEDKWIAATKGDGFDNNGKAPRRGKPRETVPLIKKNAHIDEDPNHLWKSSYLGVRESPNKMLPSNRLATESPQHQPPKTNWIQAIQDDFDKRYQLKKKPPPPQEPKEKKEKPADGNEDEDPAKRWKAFLSRHSRKQRDEEEEQEQEEQPEEQTPENNSPPQYETNDVVEAKEDNASDGDLRLNVGLCNSCGSHADPVMQMLCRPKKQDGDYKCHNINFCRKCAQKQTICVMCGSEKFHFICCVGN